jgi:hypothetical protein
VVAGSNPVSPTDIHAGQRGGVVLHDSHLRPPHIAHDQLVFYSSFMVETQRKSTALMSV